jgi:hypothetical protein
VHVPHRVEADDQLTLHHRRARWRSRRPQEQPIGVLHLPERVVRDIERALRPTTTHPDIEGLIPAHYHIDEGGTEQFRVASSERETPGKLKEIVYFRVI